MIDDPLPAMITLTAVVKVAACSLLLLFGFLLLPRIILRFREDSRPFSLAARGPFLDLLKYGLFLGAVLWILWRSVPYMEG